MFQVQSTPNALQARDGYNLATPVCSPYGLTLFASDPGLLVQIWRYQGANTLQTYLQKSDPLAALSRSLLVPKEAVVATVMQQVFQAVNVSSPACSPVPILESSDNHRCQDQAGFVLPA